MLVVQKVNDLITRQRGKALCDRCICKAMSFTSQAHAIVSESFSKFA
jgi:hypothetical protein